MTDVTNILGQIEDGDPSAAEKLLPLIYEELRKLATAKMAQEKPGQTLQATALVHDAYIRLVDAEKAQHWNGRGHFYSAAAEAMRRILIENARHKQSLKAGGDRERIALSHVASEIQSPDGDLFTLNDALARFSEKDTRAAELVKLRFFTGLTNREAAEVLGVSVATAENDWAYARSWLQLALSDSDE